ncbi:hypothetical protein C8R43DRAFT_1000407 [Mycena crocata]|nr:hypothetical protein C8R43DRAFT_1000407 [Mycena crocata]
MSSGSTSRPATSKPRGICRYYNTPRGCFNSKNCKFLHGEVATGQVPTLTPYDQSKTCRFYAAGFCKRGAQCWFSHEKGKEKEAIDDEDDLCSICFDKPITYGLLTGCSHVFCITCIKQWRDSSDKSPDVVESGNTKRCPMCRQPAKFIIPSSKFYAQGQEAKDAALARYMDSMKRVQCKYFQRSLSQSTPFCPFGKDCFYQHLNRDGSEHVTDQGVDACMRLYASRRDPPPISTGAFPHRSDLIRSLENVFAETARLGMNPHFPADGSEAMRRLEILADQMLASLAQGAHSDSESDEEDEDEAMPPLERLGEHRADDWPLPLMFDSDTDNEMPALAPVSDSSDSSDSESPSEEEDEESDSDAELDPRVSNMAIRPFDLEFDPGMEARNVNADAMDIDAETAVESAGDGNATPPLASSTDDDESEGNSGHEPEMPPLETLDREPPFVTDGRGRVVWSSSDSSYRQAGPSASDPIPGASPPAGRTIPTDKPPSPRQPSDEGGFTTDGRGHVIGTTQSRGEVETEAAVLEDEEEGEHEADDTTVQSRSFLGRVLHAFF